MALDEFTFLRWVRRRARPGRRVALGIGDDCAVIRPGRGAGPLFITTDMIVGEVDFDPATASARAIGHKAMAVNLSDAAAMGLAPGFAVCSLALPRGTRTAFARALQRGLTETAAAYGVEVVGGDLSATPGPLMVNVALFGFAGRLRPVTRAGARPGDVLLATGAFGGSILGRHLAVRPRVREAVALNRAVRPHAMIDVSDGLAADLGHILEASGVGAVLRAADVPIHRDAARAARADGRSPLDHAQTDGEDIELRVAVPPRAVARALATPLGGTPLRAIGEFTRRPGLRLQDAAGKVRRLRPGGYRHRF
ncbi:MAG: thiamine-monophosphate kinase [Planctomycetes bacterium]|nr:thiamine-monophosphate kinase [Planctomycetota bacterium]